MSFYIDGITMVMHQYNVVQNFTYLMICFSFVTIIDYKSLSAFPWLAQANNFWTWQIYFNQGIVATSYLADQDSKVHGANMGPTWVLLAPDGPHIGPMNLAIRGAYPSWPPCRPNVRSGCDCDGVITGQGPTQCINHGLRQLLVMRIRYSFGI